jgi:hypothetical protein
MLTQLTTIKDRLTITVSTYDTLLTSAIKAVGDRFDKICNRTLARTVGANQEFPGDKTEITLACFPVESVTKLELKSTEAEGWVEQTGIDYLIRNACIVSLSSRLGTWRDQGRITYTGGYVLPGTTPGAGQTALPDDLEQAAVEQVAYWFRNRDVLGLIRNWPSGGTYQVFMKIELLPSVEATLKSHERWLV